MWNLVSTTKILIYKLKDGGLNDLLKNLTLFYEQRDIDSPYCNVFI